MLSALSTINVELTNRCQKNCSMCGRRKVERDYEELAKLYTKDMDFALIEKIAKELEPYPGIVVQFHNDGDSLLYPRLGDALKLFPGQIKSLNTNGILLVEKFEEIKFLDTIVISMFQFDPDAEEQLVTLKEYMAKRDPNEKPNVIIRCLGNIKESLMKEYEKLNCIMPKRMFHSAMGSFNYKKKPTIPEIGICLEMLHHPAINVDGDVSICVRFDPHKKGKLGNVNESTLDEIWNSPKRKEWLDHHIRGQRAKHPLCAKCEFWGIAIGG